MREHAAIEVRDAATVMLVRNAPALQVFMLLRNLRSEFVGGAFVFPGGAVDPGDREAHLEPECAGRTDAEASAALGVARGGLAFWVAAIRECFEEAGVLLACHAETGEIVDFSDPNVAARFEVHRAAVDAGERRLIDVAREEHLVLDVASTFYFSHWITPVGAPRRYDTRFFVAAAPPNQTPLPDNREAVDSVWIEPSEALALAERGEMEMIFPTIKSLEAIARFSTAEELLDAAQAIDEVPTILPRITADSHGMRILLPGDLGYDAVIDPPEGSITDLPRPVPSAIRGSSDA
ncbi:MAG TPA: NUDIX hydrolase [Acidimicrobiia bacterium]|nr:NUDIX hydrolase [Acidimicrobiia bacterium]